MKDYKIHLQWLHFVFPWKKTTNNASNLRFSPWYFQHIPTVNISHSIHRACCLHVPFKYNIWKLKTNFKKKHTIELFKNVKAS